MLRVKLQSVSYSFDVADSEYDNQIALSPTVIKGEGTNLENYVCNKNVIIGSYFLYTLSNNEQCFYVHEPN